MPFFQILWNIAADLRISMYAMTSRASTLSVLCIPILLMSFFCTSCSIFGQNNAATPTIPVGNSTAPAQSLVTLSSLHWCGKALVLFQDEGASKNTTPDATVAASPTAQTTPKTLTDWTQIEPNLGFTVYLPRELPIGTCLTSVYGTFHDPILGGSFTIGYLLPDHTAISLSEDPLASQGTQFQCSPSATTKSTGGTLGKEKTTATPAATATSVPLQLCSGAHGTTSITLSARGSTAILENFFNALQPNVTWQPSS